MHRSPSLPLNDYDESSSLDPLAPSDDERDVVATRRSSSPSKRLPSSPLKPARSIKKSNEQSTPTKTYTEYVSFNPSSPSRTVTEQTLSPWKIRVTVEAEPEDDEADSRTMTRTVKIPLRQCSSPSLQEKAGTRGRRVQSSPAKKKRSGTPVRQRSGSRTRRQSLTDLDARPLGDDNDSDEWTGRQKRSPRKRSATKPRRDQSVQSESQEPGTQDEEVVSHVTSARRESTSTPPFEAQEENFIEDEPPMVQDSESSSLREIDLNRVSVRPRSQSTKRKQIQDMGLGHEAKNQSVNKVASSNRKVSANSAMSYPTPSPTSSYHGSSDEHHGKEQEQIEDEEGFDTIMESEGFTMIDLDTIPSARQYLSSPEEGVGSVHSADAASHMGQTTTISQPMVTRSRPSLLPAMRTKPSPIPSRLLPADDSSELSSYVASSPPAATQSMLGVPASVTRPGQRKVTPQIYSSPSLPSPPKQNRRSPSHDEQAQSPPKVVVQAGMALQGAIKDNGAEARGPIIQPTRRVQDLYDQEFFDGFSSGTKRELRAGLRFGEELAKRQKPSHVSQIAPRESANTKHVLQDRNDQYTIQQPNVPTQVWRGETTVQHSPFAMASISQTKDDLPSRPEAKTSETSLLSSRPSQRRMPTSARSSKTQTPQSSSVALERGILSTQARREHEWQLERQAVSREINNASPSKVIVLDDSLNEEAQDGQQSTPCGAGVPKTRGIETKREAEQHAESTSEVGSRSGSLPVSRSSIEDADVAVEQDSYVSDVDEDQDIWLQEARNDSSSPREQIDTLFTRSEQQRQRERAAQVVNKPRRSIIPSPWKRGEDVVEASTFMTNGDASGMLWNQDKVIKFGAGAVKRQSRSTGDSFDLDAMLSSPVKLATAGRKNLALRTEKHHVADSDEGYGGSVSEDEAVVTEASVHDSEREPVEDSQVEESQNSDELSEAVSEEYSIPSSPPAAVQKIAVNFNDSTMSQQTTPPPLARSSPTDKTDDRPSTPRSALKGARQSWGAAMNQNQSPTRRVIFNERSLYLNEDGEESSMSAKLDSPEQEREVFVGNAVEQQETSPPALEPSKSSKQGWLGWLMQGKSDSSSSQNSSPASKPNTKASPQQSADQQWAPTQTSLPSTTTTSKRPATKSSKGKLRTPSYLLSPSYPSVPTRDITIPLPTSGPFTDTHFRTLHIIHAKSCRPRFHAPKTIRPQLKKLEGWTMEVDEMKAGLGVFEWKVGVVETEVLERFMQEVEFGWEQAGEEVKWGWKVEELARWLGMCVVGEVVRGEEGRRKGSVNS